MVYCDGVNLISSTSQEELRSFATCMGIHSEQFKRNRLPRYILTKEQADQHLDSDGVKLYERENLL